MFWLLVMVLVVALGSMGWMTAKSGKAHKATMIQVRQSSPQLVVRAKRTKEHALARLEKCHELGPRVSV